MNDKDIDVLILSKMIEADETKKLKIPSFDDGTPWSFEEAGKRCVDLTNYDWLAEQLLKEVAELEKNKK